MKVIHLRHLYLMKIINIMISTIIILITIWIIYSSFQEKMFMKHGFPKQGMTMGVLFFITMIAFLNWGNLLSFLAISTTAWSNITSFVDIIIYWLLNNPYILFGIFVFFMFKPISKKAIEIIK